MNKRSIRLLAAVAAALVIGVFLLNRGGHDYQTADDAILLPGFRAKINDVQRVGIRQSGATITIEHEGDEWVVREKGNFAADTGKLRQILLALADARKLEQKTADPAMHDRLGLANPGEGESIGITIDGDNLHHALVVGKVAQRSYRYLRFADNDQAWLIDQNPELPADESGWLATDIVNIPSSRMREVTITHADGEQIHFSKHAEAETSFTVDNIPDGRELTYAGIVNGIAGALQNLDLDDVRKRPEAMPDATVTSEFVTTSGLTITVSQYHIDDADWLTVTAATDPAAAQPAPAAAEVPEPGNGNADTASNKATDETPADAAPAAAMPEKADPAEEAATLNARVDQWMYKVPSYKAEQLAKHWADILKPVEDDEE